MEVHQMTVPQLQQHFAEAVAWVEASTERAIEVIDERGGTAAYMMHPDKITGIEAHIAYLSHTQSFPWEE